MNEVELYCRLLLRTLYNNGIMLFDMKGNDVTLDYERHVFELYDENHVEDLKELKWHFGIQLALDLWACWEVHILKSSYSRTHQGCVHIDESWMERQDNASPPLVVLRNDNIRCSNELEASFPLNVSFQASNLLGPTIAFRIKYMLPDGNEVNAWRFYLSNCI